MTNSPTSECCPHIHSKYTSTFEIVFCLHINDDTIRSVFAINLVNITLLASFKETCCILTFSLELLLQMFSRKIVCNFLVLLECKNPLITLLWINEEVDIWFLGIVIIVFISVANSKWLIKLPKIHLIKKLPYSWELSFCWQHCFSQTATKFFPEFKRSTMYHKKSHPLTNSVKSKSKN